MMLPGLCKDEHNLPVPMLQSLRKNANIIHYYINCIPKPELGNEDK
jgi:hypothetical protein